MMKRTGVARLDEPSPLPQNPAVIQQQAGASNMHTLAQTAQPQIIARDSGRVFAGQAMVSVSGGFPRARAPAPPVINYVKPGALQYAAPKQPQLLTVRKSEPVQPVFRTAPLGSPAPGSAAAAAAPANTQFQRLKVEDALSYLDQVKFKFNTQPQVYNDFLDIMKEFKSQTIDTPGVITRVSNLFKGHPELIVGFNTFLPPGYKIEVQSNGQVSVSMPSPTALGAAGMVLGVHHNPQPQLVHLLPVPQSVSSALVHNLSVTPAPAPPQNTLHHISQAHQQIEAAAIHHAGAAGGVQAGASQHAAAAPPGQPVEFNHAIEYVNKIKSRFSRQPDKYKRFLEILHAYQRGHRDPKQPPAKQQTEQEVYSQVAKLFENQDDLLLEFGQFLPDAKGGAGGAGAGAGGAAGAGGPGGAGKFPNAAPPPPQPLHSIVFTTHSGTQHQREEPERYAAPTPEPLQVPPAHAPPPQLGKLPPAASAPAHHHLKRSPSFTSGSQMTSGAPSCKKPRPCALTGATVRDVSYAEAAKLGTMTEYSYFDRVRKALANQQVYENFLRCLLLYTNEIISSSELLVVTAPFLCRHAELQRWLQDFVAPASPPATPPEPHASYNTFQSSAGSLLSLDRELEGKARVRYEPLGALAAQLRHDRPQGDAAMDIDLSTCKRLGTSYCALPRGSAEAASRRCSGRTPLCKEVLNDTWVSFPTWSEESTFVTSRKTQYEEYIYRCEDERFELDVVIETNAATIRVLEGVQKKLSRMSSEDAARHRLDDCLGGHSPTVHQRALRRIYGDKSVDIIAGLKKNPSVAVPVVLRRLKAKEEEWREAQKGFNKQWREQNEKYYLKSLDHQGINFKQNDLKALRSKSLFNEVESAFSAGKPGPHVYVDYNMKSRQEAIKIVRDAADLLIHHARRQTAIQKAEKRRIKQLLRQFLPDLFNHPRQPLSDDERDDEENEPVGSPGSPAAAERERADSVSGAAERDKSRGGSVKLEKQESSESDNGSDKSAKHNKNNKENTPKNNNNTDTKENISCAVPAQVGVKRSSSSEDMKDNKSDTELEDDYRDHPPNEARFVCTSSWYLFLRLHSALCRRLAGARAAAQQLHAASPAPPAAAAAAAAASRLHLRNTNLPPEASSAAEYYPALLALVKGVLDGNMEPSAFEDAAREMLGIRAYPAYTLDKIVSYAVRQLQHCVSDPWSVRAAELCARGGMRAGAGYLRRAARALRDQHATFLVRAYGGDECKLTFELLEAPGEGRASPQLNNDAARLSPTAQRPLNNGAADTSAVSRCLNWSLYSERYSRLLSPAPRAGSPPAAGSSPARSPPPPPAAGKPLFLLRNARRCGGDATVNSAGGGGGGGGAAPRRRKQLHDCSLAARLRLLAARPHAGYRRGALRRARAQQPRLHARRRERLRHWLDTKQPH